MTGKTHIVVLLIVSSVMAFILGISINFFSSSDSNASDLVSAKSVDTLPLLEQPQTQASMGLDSAPEVKAIKSIAIDETCYSEADVEKLLAQAADNASPPIIVEAADRLRPFDDFQTTTDATTLAEEIMAQMDTNQDGYLSADELDFTSVLATQYILENYGDSDTAAELFGHNDPKIATAKIAQQSNAVMYINDMVPMIDVFFADADFDDDGVLSDTEMYTFKTNFYPQDAQRVEMYKKLIAPSGVF